MSRYRHDLKTLFTQEQSVPRHVTWSIANLLRRGRPSKQDYHLAKGDVPPKSRKYPYASKAKSVMRATRPSTREGAILSKATRECHGSP